MNGLARLVGLLSVLCVSAHAFSAQADDPFTDDEVAIRKGRGVQLLLPKDWPVEQRNGIQSPIPIEAYLSMKFGQVREKFRQHDKRLEDLQQRIAELEQDHKNLVKRLRLLEDQLARQEQAMQSERISRQERPTAPEPHTQEEVTHGDTTQEPQATQGPSSQSP